MTLPDEQLEVTVEPYSDKDLVVDEELHSKLERLMKFFDESGIDYGKFDPTTLPKLDFGKRNAYPNTEVYMHVPGQHNTQKWLDAIREIYYKEKNGENRVTAIRRVTSGWDVMETYDFLNWVRFYEAGDHMKYKFAQLWYENPEMGPGYFLQIKKDPAPQEPVQVADQDVDDAREEATLNSERRQLIEKQRNKIIGRLDSAEKLLRSPDGQVFSGKEFESLLESIYQLKKKIQMVNKISSSTRLYEDMIVRQANILRRDGFSKAAAMLYSVAQTPGQGGEQAQGNPAAPPVPPPPPSPGDPSGAGNPGPPSGGGGNGANTPAQPGGDATFPQTEISNPPPKGISDFIAGLQGANITPSDKHVAEDDLEVMDTEDDLLVTEAQVATPTPPLGDDPITTSPAPAPLDPSPVRAPEQKPAEGEEPLEVTDEDIAQPQGEEAKESTPSNFTAKMDAVLSGVTIADAIAELEELSKIFKTREIPRRFGRVDMIFDALGIAPFFPTLSEATNKSLEANNYIATRVDDILSKLRGATATKDVDLEGNDNKERPEMAGIKKQLQSDEDKEKARKKMRKDQETAELEGKNKETPEVEIEEDLGAPPAPPTPPTAPPRTTPPPV